MKYILDTNICIFIIKNKPDQVLKRFLKIPLGDILISSITLAELKNGIEKSAQKEKNSIALNEFIIPLQILPFDDLSADFYGKLRTFLEKKATPIGPLDLMIAAHAQSLNLTLVTNNVKEFKRVPNLLIEDWTKMKEYST